jgi:hypothetical protein
MSQARERDRYLHRAVPPLGVMPGDKWATPAVAGVAMFPPPMSRFGTCWRDVTNVE